MSAETIWLICLMITHACAYFMGKADAGDPPLSEESRLELEKHKYEKYYEHERWKAERENKHENAG